MANMQTLINGQTYEASATITYEAANLMGLDDGARYADVFRQSQNARFMLLAGTTAALTDIITELYDRATEDGTGYAHSAHERKIALRAVRRMQRQGFTPRP